MIKRTGLRAEGGITPEEKKQMEKISQKWIRNAYRTDRIDKEKITNAIKRLYKSANLEEPRIVIVPSPYVMAISYGLASAVWHLRENKKVATNNATEDATYAATRTATRDATHVATYTATYTATDDATDAATSDATYAATRDATDSATDAATRTATLDATSAATYSATDAATEDATRTATLDATRAATDSATQIATYAATYAATRDATDSATDAATEDATRAATLDATHNATYSATDAATEDATRAATSDATHAAPINGNWLKELAAFFVGKQNVEFALNCCKNWYGNYQGGNMWAGFPSYAEACREVLKLDKLDCWEKYQAWEDCAKYGGFRVMHKKFCLVCDFPKKIQAKPDGTPHCETGASHIWKDGFKIYYLNGVKVPAWLVETPPNKIDPKLALTEKNADVQREIIRKVGAERMLKSCNAEELDSFIDKTGLKYQLMKMKIGENIDRKYLYFEHATMKGVYYAKPVPPECKKAIHARAWILSMIETEDLDSVSDTEIMNNLPQSVS